MSPRRLLLVSHYRVQATWLSVVTTYVAATYGIWQGVGLMSSSPERFGSPAFAVIRRAPDAWGLAAFVFGVLVLWGVTQRLFLVKAIGLVGLSLWSLSVATMALTAYLSSPVAAPTGPPAYYFIGINLAVLVWSKQKGTRSAQPRQHKAP